MAGFDPGDHWQGPKPRLNGYIVDSGGRYFCRSCRRQVIGQPYWTDLGSVCILCGKGAGVGSQCFECSRFDLGLSKCGDGRMRCPICIGKAREELLQEEKKSDSRS
jgi:hypothetical protein